MRPSQPMLATHPALLARKPPLKVHLYPNRTRIRADAFSRHLCFTLRQRRPAFNVYEYAASRIEKPSGTLAQSIRVFAQAKESTTEWQQNRRLGRWRGAHGQPEFGVEMRQLKQFSV